MFKKNTFAVGNIVHVLNRGVKKLPIYREKSDLWRLTTSLFYRNSKNTPENMLRDLEQKGLSNKLVWLDNWGKREQLVNVLAFTIMPNHFHLVIEEIEEGGISKFIQKISISHSKYINAKYNETGSLFQPKYKSVVVESDGHFNQLAYYVMVKNPFELYKGGIKKACQEFDKAYKWASMEYPFTSLGDYAGERVSPIITKSIFGDCFGNSDKFKKEAKQFILGYLDKIEIDGDFKLE